MTKTNFLSLATMMKLAVVTFLSILLVESTTGMKVWCPPYRRGSGEYCDCASDCVMHAAWCTCELAQRCCYYLESDEKKSNLRHHAQGEIEYDTNPEEAES